jgi:hypothetical protein
MRLLAGAMQGIRNPRAHEHTWVDDRDTAIELLTLASHLYKRCESASRCQPVTPSP